MGLKEAGLRGSLRNASSVLPAFFDVTVTNTNSPVREGDVLSVDYSANNTGDVQDTQDIRLEIDSVEEDRDSNVTLAGGVSTTGTLQWDTTNENATTYTATVLSNDDSDSVTVEVESAIPDSEVDRFEWGGPVSDRYSGATADFAINSNAAVFEGSFSIKSSGLETTSITSYPGEGLANYPSRGDWIRGYVRAESGVAAPGIVCFAESGRELNTDLQGYVVTFAQAFNELRLGRSDGGSATVIDSTAITESTGVWYYLDIYSNSSDIQAELRQAGDTLDDPAIATVSATDSTYSGQGTGVRKLDSSVVDDINLKQDHGLP